MSGNRKKDKGKNIRRAEDYQLAAPDIQQHPSKVPVFN